MLSAHAEALHTAEFDGDLPGTLADLELSADPDDEALTAAYAAAGFHPPVAFVAMAADGARRL